MGECPGDYKGIQGKMWTRGLQGIYGSSGEKSRKVGNLPLISKMTVRDAYEVFGNCLDMAPRVLDISPMQR